MSFPGVIFGGGSTALSTFLADSSGYYAATNLEDLAKETYEALTTNTPAWDIHINTLQLLVGTSINELSIDGGLAGNSDNAVPTEKAVKSYVDAAVVGASLYAFKTITGITNDVVADQIADTLTLASANNRLTIVGTTATDTITFTLVEGNIDHDALANYDANKHIDHTAVTLTAGSGLSGGGTIAASRTFDLGALTGDWDAGSFKITAEQLESDVAAGTPPLVVASTDVVANLNVDQVDGYDLDQALLQASSPTFVGLTLSGAIGGVTTLSMSGQLTNTLAIGTAPFVITSTDVVANLNVDMVDGYHLDQGVLIASTPTFAGLTVNGAMTLNGAITGVNSIACDLGTGINEFSIDGTLVGNSDDALPTEKAVKSYVDGAVGGASLYAFKTITGITNDVVADAIGDTLTFTSGNAILTIVGTTATDTVTFTIDQAQISHDSIADVSADDHHKAPSDAAYGAGWNGVVDQAPTKNAVYDQLVTHYADADEHHAQSHTIVSHSDATLADPGADQMVFWDDSDSKFEFLVANTGLSIVGNNLNCDITQYTDGLARTACLEDDVYGAGWDADVTHAPTQNAVYDKINAMDILIAANTTVLEVEAVITAELVNGQSIDNAIDALINTHNVANRHIDHSAVSITAGVGLSGGGTIAASRTIDCDITQYTNAMAVAAVQAADPLALTNELTISGTGASSCAGDFHVLGDHELGSVQSVADPEGVVLQIDYSNANTSSRIFFREADVNLYGASIVYAGDNNPIFDGTTFTLAANKWYFITHSNSLTGTVAFSIARGATQVDFVGNIVCGGNLTAANIVTAGNVDGVDVSTFKTAYDTHVAAGDIHIAHSGVTITAGTGLSGGGTIAASRTINCDITQYTDGLARTACLEDDAYGAGWDTDVTHAPTQNAVYDKIAAMDILIAANTTVVEVEAVITAELVNGQSIDNAIDSLISTHNVANRHIDHSAVSVTAGTGLSGGGTIAATRTINCDITQYTDALAKAACVSDVAYGAGWNGVTDVAPSKNTVYDGTKHKIGYPVFNNYETGNGAAPYTGSALSGVYMPPNDNDCFFVCHLRVPDDWADTTPSIKILLMVEVAAQAYSWRVTVTKIDHLDAWSGVRILNASAIWDVAATTALNIVEHSIVLANVEADNMLHLSCASDANNGTGIYILGAWLEPT